MISPYRTLAVSKEEESIARASSSTVFLPSMRMTRFHSGGDRVTGSAMSRAMNDRDVVDARDLAGEHLPFVQAPRGLHQEARVGPLDR